MNCNSINFQFNSVRARNLGQLSDYIFKFSFKKRSIRKFIGERFCLASVTKFPASDQTFSLGATIAGMAKTIRAASACLAKQSLFKFQKFQWIFPGFLFLRVKFFFLFAVQFMQTHMLPLQMLYHVSCSTTGTCTLNAALVARTSISPISFLEIIPNWMRLCSWHHWDKWCQDVCY